MLNTTSLSVSNFSLVFSGENCPSCHKKMIKNGVSATGKQRYRCKNCGTSRVAQYTYKAYDPNLNKNIVALTKEGVGIMSTARLLGISPTTLLDRLKKIAAEIKEPVLVKGKTYEVDELRTFVKKKEINLGGECLLQRK